METNKGRLFLALACCCALVLSADLCACSGPPSEDSSATQPPESVDTWAYSSTANSWARLKTAGPVPVEIDYVVYDSDTGKVIVFPQDFKSTWTYDPAAISWSEVSPPGVVPPERTNGSTAYDPLTGRVVLFGGWHASSPMDAGTTFNDTWSYDPVANVWSESHPSGELPVQGWSGAMICDSTGGRLILFEGHDEGRDEASNDTWAYDPAANAWTGLGRTNGPMRYLDGCSVAYVPATRMVYLFGGSKIANNDYDSVNATWAYDIVANTWAQLDPAGDLPAGRQGAPLLYDPVGDRLLLHGGNQQIGGILRTLTDTWAYDPKANTWTALNAAGGTWAVVWSDRSVYDPVTGMLLVFVE